MQEKGVIGGCGSLRESETRAGHPVSGLRGKERSKIEEWLEKGRSRTFALLDEHRIKEDRLNRR